MQCPVRLGKRTYRGGVNVVRLETAPTGKFNSVLTVYTTLLFDKGSICRSLRLGLPW